MFHHGSRSHGLFVVKVTVATQFRFPWTRLTPQFWKEVVALDAAIFLWTRLRPQFWRKAFVPIEKGLITLERTFDF